MLFGRPVQLWNGLLTALGGAVTLTLVALGFDAAVITPIIGGWSLVFGAIVILVAGQPPVVKPDSEVIVQTAANKTNAAATLDVAPATGQVVATTTVASKPL